MLSGKSEIIEIMFFFLEALSFGNSLCVNQKLNTAREGSFIPLNTSITTRILLNF